METKQRYITGDKNHDDKKFSIVIWKYSEDNFLLQFYFLLQWGLFKIMALIASAEFIRDL